MTLGGYKALVKAMKTFVLSASSTTHTTCHLNALCMTPHVPLARRLVSPTRHSCKHSQRQVRGWCQVVRASAAVQTKTLKIGTRGSPLALAQAYLTRRLLQVRMAQQPESSTKQAEKALSQALPVAHTHHGVLPCGGCQSYAACEALGDAVPMLRHNFAAGSRSPHAVTPCALPYWLCGHCGLTRTAPAVKLCNLAHGHVHLWSVDRNRSAAEGGGRAWTSPSSLRQLLLYSHGCPPTEYFDLAGVLPAAEGIPHRRDYGLR